MGPAESRRGRISALCFFCGGSAGRSLARRSERNGSERPSADRNALCRIVPACGRLTVRHSPVGGIQRRRCPWHGHVERFGGVPLGGVGRDEELARDLRGAGGRDASALVAHQHDACRRELRAVDVVPFQKRAVDRRAGGALGRQIGFEVAVVDPHAQDRAHRGLYDFGVETVGRRLGANHVADAEPVGQPDDRPQIARVLHVVERQHQRPAQLCGIESAAGDLDEGQRVGRGFQQREPFHLFRRDRRDVLACENAVERIDAADAERRGAQFADEFPAFGDEKPLVGAGAFVRQRADESDVGFGQHLKGRFSIVKVRPSSARSLAGKSVRASSSSGASSL